MDPQAQTHSAPAPPRRNRRGVTFGLVVFAIHLGAFLLTFPAPRASETGEFVTRFLQGPFHGLWQHADWRVPLALATDQALAFLLTLWVGGHVLRRSDDPFSASRSAGWVGGLVWGGLMGLLALFFMTLCILGCDPVDYALVAMVTLGTALACGGTYFLACRAAWFRVRRLAADEAWEEAVERTLERTVEPRGEEERAGIAEQGAYAGEGTPHPVDAALPRGTPQFAVGFPLPAPFHQTDFWFTITAWSFLIAPGFSPYWIMRTGTDAMSAILGLVAPLLLSALAVMVPSYMLLRRVALPMRAGLSWAWLPAVAWIVAWLSVISGDIIAGSIGPWRLVPFLHAVPVFVGVVAGGAAVDVVRQRRMGPRANPQPSPGP